METMVFHATALIQFTGDNSMHLLRNTIWASTYFQAGKDNQPFLHGKIVNKLFDLEQLSRRFI